MKIVKQSNYSKSHHQTQQSRRDGYEGYDVSDLRLNLHARNLHSSETPKN